MKQPDAAILESIREAMKPYKDYTVTFEYVVGNDAITYPPAPRKIGIVVRARVYRPSTMESERIGMSTHLLPGTEQQDFERFIEYIRKVVQEHVADGYEFTM